MKGFSYEYEQRPNYEMWALGFWLAGSVGVLWLYWRLDLPVLVYQVMGIICAAMALGRGIPAVERYLQDRRLKGGKILWFMSWKTIKQKVGRHAQQVWLGEGFPWTQQEIQRATEIMNKASAEFMRQSEGRWIHGLGGGNSLDLEVSTRLLDGHTLVVGSTGTGKTRLFDMLISQAIMRNETVIIIDPKGDHDLREKARLACERTGAADRFLYFHPALAERSVRLGPLKNWNRATELASRVAALISAEAKNDPFKDFGWMALDSIIQGMVYLDREPNLLQLRRYIEGGVDDILWPALRKYFVVNWPTLALKNKVEDVIKQYREKSREKSELAVDGLIRMYLHNREHFQKMVSSLIPVLSMLTSGNLRYLLSPDSNDGDPRLMADLATLIERNSVLYVGLDSLPDATVGSAIGSILLADLTAVAGARHNQTQQGQEFPPVNIFIDEAAEVMNEPAIQLLNKGRSAGFRAVIAMQTLADLEVRTGSKAGARQVIGNTNCWIIFRVLDGETQKYIGEALPKTAVKTLDMGYRSGSRSDDPVQFSAMYTESLREKPTELFPPALLGMLPDFHYFCRLPNGTWKGKLPIIEY